jgi:hypothetical protein
VTITAAAGAQVAHAVANSHAGSVLTFVGPIGFFAAVIVWLYFNRKRI